MQYPAIVTKEGEFTLAEFPDCPGCQTFVRGDADIEGAAREALEGWLDANLGREMLPNRPGTVAISKRAHVRNIAVPLNLSLRLELRRARDEAGLTQAEFAETVGMTQQQYARLEGAASNPTLSTLDRIASRAGLGLSVTRVAERSQAYHVSVASRDRAIESTLPTESATGRPRRS